MKLKVVSLEFFTIAFVLDFQGLTGVGGLNNLENCRKAHFDIRGINIEEYKY
jgi:hypothetical protein